APEQLAVVRQEGRHIQPATLERSGAEIVDDDISTSDQLLEDAQVFLHIDVERNAELVSIDAQIVGTFAALIERWTATSRFDAGSRPLDLDDVRAEVAKCHGGEWAGQRSGEIDYSKSCEW